MIRIQIKKQNKVTNQADFKNAIEGTAWLDKNKKINAFGKNQRELVGLLDQGGNYSVPDENLADAISFRDEVDPVTLKVKRYFLFPAEYETIVTDVTQEYTDRDTERIERDSLRLQLKQLHTDLQNANSLAEVKPILVKLMKYIYLTN